MKKGIFIGLCALFTGMLLFVGRGTLVAGEEQQIKDSDILKFSHQKHLLAGVDCAQCHNAGESTAATDRILPTHNECQACHEDEINEKCTMCHTGEDNMQALPNPVREINFNHQLHVNGQAVACETCHKGLDKTDYAGPENLPSMATCVTCHDNSKAPKQCEICHLNTASLRPASHDVANFKREHGRVMNLRTFDAQCQNCHTEQSCADCHDGTNLTTLSFGNKTGMLSPRVSGNDKPEVLKGEMVHSINYRFTHGIEAKGKAIECQTCHNDQQFCSDCHMSGSVALGGTVPTSHEGVGFTTIGVGSGGGRHAQLAKRDIQSCMSCHDVEGGDPTCITCHIDPDGVKGNNPKTHAIGFMKNEHGDWHDDLAANCYVCHTDPNAKPNGKAGIGFCGYCHGSK